MRRLAALAVLAIAVGMPAVAANAAQETPQGRFSSPTRATADAPMWIRSVTPCPRSGGYEYVLVGIKDQLTPHALTYIESTAGDLRSDGSWEVTLAAPADMADGITKSYSVQAQCIRNGAEYEAPDRAESTETTLDPVVSYFRYFNRTLHVTGFGVADADAPAAASDDGGATTTTMQATTTTAPTTATTERRSTSDYDRDAADADAVVVKRDDPRLLKLDEERRAAEARAELAGRDDDDAVQANEVALVASSGTPRPETDGGLPWWSFVAATMLAVGAVIAWGTRRAASVLD